METLSVPDKESQFLLERLRSKFYTKAQKVTEINDSKAVKYVKTKVDVISIAQQSL